MNVFILIFSLFVTAQPAYTADVVKVGVALRFAPEKNSFADSLYEGIELALEDFNSKQEATKVELVKYPHKEGHDSVEAAAKKIVKDQVRYVLGAEMSDDAFTLADTFQGKDILLVTATASNPLLTAGRPFVYRTCFTDDQVAALFAKYVAGLKGVRSIGVLHNTANAYSDFVTNAFLDQLEKLRSTKNPVSLSEFRYATEQPKFDSAVDQFKKANVDLVVAFTLQESLKTFQLLATKAGLKPLYVGSDGWGTTESLLKAIPDLHGIRSEYWNQSSQSSSVAKFKNQFQKKYGKQPNGWSAVAYDSAVVLFEAISKAKIKTDTSDVANHLKTNVFQNTVTATTIRFGRNNSAKKPLYLYEIKDGKAQLLKAVE